MKKRLRVITYAWGEDYVEKLLDITLAAVLAPGNLPALAEVFDCEFVLLTEQGLFAKIEAHPVYRRLAGIAKSRLIAIDDLLVAPLYGMTLTWATYRGMADLGDAVTDTDFLFFTADWVPADGSYRSLIAPLQRRERLIVAPSYCVVSENVLPILRARIDPDTRTLAIPKREMAAIGIPNRHNTIRGKTVNSHLFHMDVVEQFYWLVDRATLLAHQMPIAIVCMRPEKWMPEPDTFWDYGTVSELCPTTAPFVLGDSDDFLMLELRSEGTYDDGLRLGWPTTDMIGGKLAGFVTKDHTVYGRHQLVLHSGDLPPETGAARARLGAFVDEVFRHFDGREVAHAQHPFWAFQSSLFDIARKAAAEGRLTPALWSRNSKALTSVIGGEITTFEHEVRKAWSDVTSGGEANSVREALAKQLQQRLTTLEQAIKVEEAIHQRDIVLAHKDVREQRMAMAERLDDIDFTAERATGKQPDITRLAASAPTSARRIGKTDPMYAPLRYVRRATAASPPENGGAILAISSAGPERAIARFGLARRPVVALSPRTAARLEASDFPPGERFDLCVADLDAADMFHLRRIFDRVLPLMRPGGKFVGFHFHETLRAPAGDSLFIRKAFPRCDWGRVYFSGSYPSAVMLYAQRRIARLLRRICGDRSALPDLISRATLALPAWLVNTLDESAAPAECTVPPSRYCTATTIEIDI